MAISNEHIAMLERDGGRYVKIESSTVNKGKPTVGMIFPGMTDVYTYFEGALENKANLCSVFILSTGQTKFMLKKCLTLIDRDTDLELFI